MKSQIPSWLFEGKFDNMQSDLCLNDQPRSSSKKDNLESDGRHPTHVGSKTDQAIGYSIEPLSSDAPQEATDSSSNEHKNVASLSLYVESTLRI